MSKVGWICAVIGAAVIIGCGGSGESTTGVGSVSGNVADLNGNPVRNALVYASADKAKSTRTNSSGAFLLTGVREGAETISAEISIGGVTYYGENVISVFSNEQSKSANIAIGRVDQLAKLTGTVRDRFGDPIQGARVFAKSGDLSSVMALTNKNGKYFLNALHPNRSYTIQASALGYDSDMDILTFSPRQERGQDYVLSNPRNVAFTAPNDLSAVAWTSPREVTRSPQLAQRYEAIKQLLDPRRAARAAKEKRPLVTALGNWIEVDLYWTPIENASLLGYGIYRGRDAQGATTGIEFLRDPLTGFFADQDLSLREGLNYYYEITVLNVLYPDTFDSESDFSNRFGVRPIGDLTLRSVTPGTPVKFNWNAASGAEKYTVYIFDQQPNFGASPIWPVGQTELANATTTNTTLTYSGAPLAAGTYYYIIAAADTRNGNDAISLSPVGSFVVN